MESTAALPGFAEVGEAWIALSRVATLSPESTAVRSIELHGRGRSGRLDVTGYCSLRSSASSVLFANLTRGHCLSSHLFSCRVLRRPFPDIFSMTQEPVHVAVMPREVLHYLQLSPGLTVMDGTVGAGGHSAEILKQIGAAGRLVGFDRDPMMLAHASRTLNQSNCTLIHSTYSDAREQLANAGILKVDRVLLDLGLSSDQLIDEERGFGFASAGKLDMRFDVSSGRSVAELLNQATEAELCDIMTTFGEERFATQIAAEIVRRRTRHEFETTTELEDCVRSAIPRTAAKQAKNPATRVFQAFRIAVNKELDHLHDMMVNVLPQILESDGIAVILTFHSLEDRIVKSAFKGHQGWQVLTKKPVEATPAEVRLNPRSRSARLRVARRFSP